jgi:hypothetical protein
MLSDYMYAMAAYPLVVQPIRKFRFIPNAHARWNRFLAACESGSVRKAGGQTNVDCGSGLNEAKSSKIWRRSQQSAVGLVVTNRFLSVVASRCSPTVDTEHHETCENRDLYPGLSSSPLEST